jgi:hypothetical protein
MRSYRFLLAAPLLAISLALGTDVAGEQHTTYRDPTHRFSVTLPAGWQRASESLTPHLLDPREILSAGTFTLHRREGECAHVPTGALELLGPTDAFVTVQERGHGHDAAGFAPRPAHFSARDGTPSEAVDCVHGRPRFTVSAIAFADGRRRFHALVAFGPRASQRARREAFGILDSLRFDPSYRPSWRDSG